MYNGTFSDIPCGLSSYQSITHKKRCRRLFYDEGARVVLDEFVWLSFEMRIAYCCVQAIFEPKGGEWILKPLDRDTFPIGLTLRLYERAIFVEVRGGGGGWLLRRWVSSIPTVARDEATVGMRCFPKSTGFCW
jgi:hypothetical protein